MTNLLKFEKDSYYYPRKRSLGQGNIFAPVCHSVHKGEYLGRYPPWQVPPSRYTPWQVHLPAVTPPGRYTPLGRYPLLCRYTHSPTPRQAPPWQVHPPAVHAGIRSTRGGTHPTGMHSCFCEVLDEKFGHQVQNVNQVKVLIIFHKRFPDQLTIS